MKRDFINKKNMYKNWTILSFIIVIVWAIVLYIIITKNETKKELYLNSKMNSFSSKINATLGTYECFSNYIFEKSINKPEILEIIKEANSLDYKSKEIYREKIKNKLKEDYVLAKKYDFRQFNFIFPNGEVFFRFHAPEKFGDNLLSVRKTIKIANLKKQYVKGFEEGRIYNGYRFVYPLKYKNHYIGLTEISISMETLIKLLSKLYTNTDIIFLIEKNIVKKTVFQDKQDNYIESFILKNYFLDKEINQFFINRNNLFTLNERTEIFSKIKLKIEKKVKTKESFSEIVKNYKGKCYIIQFLALKNYSGEYVGYLLSVEEDKQFDKIFGNFYIEVILISLIFIIFIILSFKYEWDKKKLEESSNIDFLTKLYNRVKFMEYAEKELQRVKKDNGRFSIIMMDIDFFKKVNDKYGHNTGDKVLKDVGNIISKEIRNNDILARWGGEEFICLIPNSSMNTALIVAERVRRKIDKTKFDIVGHITISMGVYQRTEIDDTIESIIDKADKALYVSKADGRNRVTTWIY